jgi:thymidylate synthase
MLSETFVNAQDAFESLYEIINAQPVSDNGTRKLYNVGIKILEPDKNLILTRDRLWSEAYAKREWDWYVSRDRSVAELKKYAPIWDKMHSGNNIVNSNYGFLWNQNDQLEKVIQKLQRNKNDRQAWVTIYDGKDIDQFKFDTPCTLAIGFTVEHGLLCMSVLMRSNDLWYGFCNDQYCFSKLMMDVARRLSLDLGWYYHYSFDMHLYKQHFNKL